MKIKQPYPSPYGREESAKDCHDWVTSHDVIAAALGAFYAAQRGLDDPENFPVRKRGQGRYWMAEDLVATFEQLIHDHAYRRQVPGFTSWATDMLKLRRADTVQTADTEIVDNLSTTMSPRRHDIHRRASQNEKTED